MSEFTNSSAPAPGAFRESRSRSSGSRSKINGRLGILLCLVVFVAPIALGSNRPLAWALWATILGVVGVYFAIAMARSGEELRVRLDMLKAETVLFCLLVGYLLAQLIPVGGVPIANASGLDLAAPQISVAPGATFLMLLRMLTYGLFAFLMLQATVNASRRKSILNILLLIVVVHALYGLVALFQFDDTILGGQKWAYQGSATGTFVNRNSFATFLAFGAAIASANLAGVLTSPDRQKVGTDTTLYLVALAILLITTVATNSRMGLLVWAVAVVIPMVCLLAKTRVSRLAVVGSLLAVFAVAVVVLVYYGGSLVERIGDLEESTTLRTTLYQQTVGLIATRPWTGYGGGSFENAFYLVHGPGLSFDQNWDRAHNTYLGLWSELGLIFGTLPMLVLLLVGWRIQSSLRSEGSAWTAQAAALAVLGAGALHSVLDFSLEIQGNTLLFLAVIATGLAASLDRRRS